MATTPSTKRSLDELARLGIEMETPKVHVPQEPDVETVSESDLSQLAGDEAFMNEAVQIRLATTTDPNAPPHAVVTVNSSLNRAVIPRGRPVWVKRLHVEVLARMRETRYTQPSRNMMDPESGNALLPQHAQVYPFEVLKDNNPRGRAWLERVLAEAN
jgi:hypothetical protein